MHDWVDVIAAEGSNRKAGVYQEQLDAAMDRFFPIRTTRRKSTDLPWINRAIRKRIRRRNRIYRKEGRSALWKRIKKVTDSMIADRKKVYMDRKKKQLTDPGASREFFKLVKSFNTHEKPQTFDVRSLSKATSDTEVAEELSLIHI